MVDLATRGVCVVAAITSLIFVCAHTSGLQSSDLPVQALAVAPYLLLVLMAGSVSDGSTAPWVRFIATLFLALWGNTNLNLRPPTPKGDLSLGLRGA
jgi:membrane protease YdiL (CAAX protease family)